KRGGDNLLVDEFNVRHILIKPSEIRSEEEAAQLIQRLYQRIRAGESFADLARSFSEDPGSALNAGSLNSLTADAMVPAFPDEMREQQARNLLQNRKFDEELQTWLLEIRDEAHVEIKS